MINTIFERVLKRRKAAERRFCEGQALGEFKHLWCNVEILELEEGGVKVIFYGDDYVWMRGDAVIKKIEIKLSQPVALSVFAELYQAHGLAGALHRVLALNNAAEWPREKIPVPEILVKWEALLEELERLKQEREPESFDFEGERE